MKNRNLYSKKFYDLFEEKINEMKHKDNYIEIISSALLVSVLNYNLSKNTSFNCYKKKYKDISFFKNIVDIDSEIINNLSNDFLNFFKLTNFSLDSLEQILGNVLEKHVNRRSTGTYYTPNDVADFITSRTIVLSLLNISDEREKNIFLKNTGFKNKIDIINFSFCEENEKYSKYIDILIKKNIKNLRVLDPTCGSGSFIMSAFNFLCKYNDVDLVLNCIHGVDISKEAIFLVKLRLYIRLFNSNRLYSKNILLIEKKFICSNSLDGPDFKLKNGEGFDWRIFKKKFNCILGNPPYFEKKDDVINSDFLTSKIRNIYPNVIERAFNVCETKGYISMIVPISLISTQRMKLIRDFMTQHSSEIYMMSFGDRPCCLFKGVHQKLVIFISEIGESKCQIFTSSYKLWYKNERKKIFNNIEFVESDNFYKIGTHIEKKILEKVTKNEGNPLSSFVSLETTDYKCEYSTRIGFWPKCFISNFDSKEKEEIYFCSEKNKILFNSIVNSSLFYFLWICTSDCWHLTKQIFDLIKINQELYTDEIFKSLKNLSYELELDINRNKININSKQSKWEFKHKYSKRIIDEIDKEISKLFAFSIEEITYIINFNLTYRMNTNIPTSIKNRFNVVDLFSGVGGFSEGFKNAGFNIILANEIDSEISKSYSINNPETIMVNDNISNIIPVIKSIDKHVDVVIGGPPCQGFSLAGRRNRSNGNEFLNDDRNYLFREYFNVIKTLEPDFFVMENVPGLMSMMNGKIFKEIINIFEKSSNFKKGPYHLYHEIMDASNFGVPQNRKRLIIIGSKNKINFKEEIKNLKKEMIANGEIYETTIKDAISDLNFLESGEGDEVQEYKINPESKYQEKMRNSDKLYNHYSTQHKENIIKRISELSPGDKKENLSDWGKIKSTHSGAYERMKWSDKSKTITTRFDTPSSGAFIHPERDRTITPREAARLQSFNDKYIFIGNKSSITKQIGNAVPPLLSYFIARLIRKVNK